MHTAQDLMRRHVIAVSPQTSSDDAIDLLIEHEVSGLPVVDKAGRILGIFSEIDQVQRGDMERRPVEQVMSKRVLSVDVHESWTEVARIFHENSVHRLPVTESGLLVGIIGLRDLISFIRDTECARENAPCEKRPVGCDLAKNGSSKTSADDRPISPESQSCTSLGERREATRFRRESGTDFAVLLRESEEELLVEVHDESLTGLGILADGELGLCLGAHIQIVYAGECLDGEVAHVTPRSGGKVLVGLRCQRIYR